MIDIEKLLLKYKPPNLSNYLVAYIFILRLNIGNKKVQYVESLSRLNKACTISIFYSYLNASIGFILAALFAG